MPYRPKRRRAIPSRTSNGSGNGTRHQGSYAVRLAMSRGLRQKRTSSSAGAIVVLLLAVVVGVGSIISVTALAAGGAAAVTIATLQQDLPDVRAFQDLGFSQPTRIYDRKGKTVLAQFWEERREVLEFEEFPKFVLDVTTAVEDDTYWDNPGFDLEATVNAGLQELAGANTDRGGGSTITQQLVRRNLLPDEVIANDNTRDGLYLRKAKELIQSYRLTQAYPGEEGKRAIITAYLNDIPYGANAYGIAAASEVYFGKPLSKLSISEAATLAGIPQAPTANTLFKHAKTERYGKKKKRKNGKRTRNRRIVLKEDSQPMLRRNFVLKRLREGNGRWTSLTEEQYQDALAEKIVLRNPKPQKWKAPWFVNALIPELQTILADRDPIQRGGYRVITTLDWRAQRLGEKLIEGGARLPNLPSSQYFQELKRLGLRGQSSWISRLRGANLHNGALVAMDYRTGDILGYVGSAGYYRKKTRKFAPRVDHVAGSHRQPGSAWKAILYASGIDSERLTAGTFLLDKREQFGPGWTPQNADKKYRGPIQARSALQQSLNIPAIRALQRTGSATVRRYAVKAGFTFLDGNNRMLDEASLAGALGTVEVRPLDMTAAFGAFGNDGKVTQPRYILRVEDSEGNVIYRAGDPVTKQVWKPQTAFIMADMLSGNTSRAINPAWGAVFEMRNTRDGSRRVAAVKTGTTNQLKDYSTYGILPMPKSKKRPALAVGVWYGNSDSSSPNLNLLRFSLDNAGRTWAAFVKEYTKNTPTATFQRPKGLVRGPVLGSARTEWYIAGTEPGGARAVDRTAPRITTPSTDSSSSGGSSSGSTTRRGGGGGGGGDGPRPTCRPGSTTVPRGCTIPAPD